MKNLINGLVKGKNKTLIILVIFSFLVLPITYSRYIERGYGETFSSLANWNVDMISNDSEEISLFAHNESNASYSFNITSTSEVSSEYSLTLLNIPKNISVYVDDIKREVNDENKVVINTLGGFEVGSANTTNSHIITFKTNNNTQAGNIKVDLDVTIRQKLKGDVVSNE